MSDQAKEKMGPLPGTHGKRPYVRPVLRRLGSVRELTLGGGLSHTADGSHSTRKPAM